MSFSLIILAGGNSHRFRSKVGKPYQKIAGKSLIEINIDKARKIKAIKKIVEFKANLVVYQVKAITKGADAQAEVSVRLENEGISVLGIGNDIDTIVASGKAYISALNKLIHKKDKAEDTKKSLNPRTEKIDKHVI